MALMEKLIGETEFLQDNPPKFVPQEDRYEVGTSLHWKLACSHITPVTCYTVTMCMYYVHVCACAYMCVHVHVLCACICVHVHALCACICVHVHALCACICVHVHVLCTCACMCACAYMCVHVHTCVCMCIHVCACAYTHTNSWSTTEQSSIYWKC